MTKREAAIVSAYTGYLIGEFSDFHAYAEEIIGRQIFTHEIPNITYELKEKSKNDFMNINIYEKEIPEWIYHTPGEWYSEIDFNAIEKALGFRLFGWQKGYIMNGAMRRYGKTTAFILKELLRTDLSKVPLDLSDVTKNYKEMAYDIWNKLHTAGVNTITVFFTREDKEKFKKG